MDDIDPELIIPAFAQKDVEEYEEIRELNQKALKKQHQLRRKKRVAKWVKCIDCKYMEIKVGRKECNPPTYCANQDIEFEFIPDDNYDDGYRMESIACNHGKLKR